MKTSPLTESAVTGAENFVCNWPPTCCGSLQRSSRSVQLVCRKAAAPEAQVSFVLLLYAGPALRMTQDKPGAESRIGRMFPDYIEGKLTSGS